MHALTEVHYDWGTARVWNEAGIAALFAGPPGTGKTMAAEILALKLDLPMYRIDLSQVVNKYIGETEKNLKRLFDAADVTLTAAVLSAFALAVPFESLSHLLSRAIFATRDTLLQVLASLAGLGVTIVATLALLPSQEILAIPLGFTIGQVAKTAMLALALWVRVRTSAWRVESAGAGP